MSVDEQNSFDLARHLLMGGGFADLRRCIYRNIIEFKRSNQLLMIAVAANRIHGQESQGDSQLALVEGLSAGTKKGLVKSLPTVRRLSRLST
jgi:hypothetical protein